MNILVALAFTFMFELVGISHTDLTNTVEVIELVVGGVVIFSMVIHILEENVL